MRRATIWVVWLLLAAEVAWLGGQPRRFVEAVVALEPAVGLRARSQQTDEGITFVLENHAAESFPKLSVTARESLDQALHYERTGTHVTVVTLARRHLERYPAQMLHYTWTTDGIELPGEHLYINPAYAHTWNVRQNDLLTIYYTGAYPGEVADQWTVVYRWLAGFLLLQQPPSQTVYLMPEIADLRRAVNLAPGDNRQLAGLWVERAESILLAPGTDRTKTMAHELIHALLYNSNPIWWEEGIATWIAYKEAAHRSRQERDEGWEATRVAMEALHRLALEKEISLDQVDQSQTYPLDRYTVGTSFMLYVRARLGEPGILLLAVAAAARPLEQAVPEILGETLEQAKQSWLAYIRSSRFLQDASTP